MSAGSDMGPIVTRASRDRIVSLITSGEESGAKVVVDGRDLVVPGHENGFFVGPDAGRPGQPGHGGLPRGDLRSGALGAARGTVDEAIDLINANPYGNGTAIFTSHGGAARKFVRGVKVGMIGVNVPVPVPMAYHSFGGWKNSLFGEHHVHGPDGVRFYTRAKVVTQRWPELERDASFDMPTAR